VRIQSFLFVLVICVAKSYASDLGTYGDTYPIVEKDAIELFKAEVTKGLADGGKERLVSGARQRFVDEMSNIPPAKGVSVAKQSQSRIEDLTERVNRDILDDKKQVIVEAGSTINPLTIHPLTKKIFFIDARQPDQLKFVKERAEQRDKIILTAGNLWTTQQYLKRHVYLDMGMAHKMRIQVTPSVASQAEHGRLKIEEVAL
jgi:conjugal transfer pilus assembly protein TraW